MKFGYGVIVWLCMLTILGAKGVPQKDIEVRIGKSVQLGQTDAKMVYFGGYTTPECKLAISKDGRTFYFKKVGSRCEQLINSKKIKIICNSNRSVCKTRKELSDIITGEQDNTIFPSWCKKSGLNKTEHMICADETLGRLDAELTKLYSASSGKQKAKEQKAWLAQRNNCVSKPECIKQAYETRIRQLKEQEEAEEIDRKYQAVIEELYVKEQKDKCAKNDKEACCLLGIAYDHGKLGVAENNAKEAEYYRKACKLGSSKSCYNLGIMYANGEGMRRDLHQALSYLERGCDKGYERACGTVPKIREGLENAFRGTRRSKCYSIKEYGLRQVCLEGTSGNACNALQDYALQRVCREGAGTDACYGLKKYAMQRICKEGIGGNACYGLHDYTMQQSCKKFKGSTTFWILMSHYGYYTQ
jgi:uncharacterized protein